MPENGRSALRIGVDTGGTFTDFVVYDPSVGTLRTFKLPSTPQNPALAVLEGLRQVLSSENRSDFQVIHGSTVATNALLERKGARTALVTTSGFRDVLVIGRQNRPDLYDLSPALPLPIVPANLRLEINERVDARGAVLRRLDLDEVERLAGILSADRELESAAVCFLFSFLNPAHEQAVAERLRTLGLFVSVSHEILPEYREYERTATTVVNAYVAPVLDRYLGELEAAVTGEFRATAASSLSIMQSNGGTISPGQARREAVRCILSGPAGGLIAADHLGAQQIAPVKNLMTFDMGGTSTDVSLITDRPLVTTESEIGGLPIRVPVLDIHTIGAGGGSIAYLDPGGGLRVGPESAGASPGPACYGRDLERLAPTVTDANLVLGRLLPDHFLGGKMPLYPDRARAALVPLAESLALSLEETAAGIIAIADAHMVRALRVISVARGHDPARFSLVSFGGAGGLHAVSLARELGIPKVIVPKHASTFSALGMLQADVLKDYSRTVMLPGDTDLVVLYEAMEAMRIQARADLQAEKIRESAMVFNPQMDVRYRGQSYEIKVPFTATWLADFERKYLETYGFAPTGEVVEIVNLRLQARGTLLLPELAPLALDGHSAAAARIGETRAWTGSEMASAPVFEGDLLKPGNRISGSAIVVRSDTTIWIGKADLAEVDVYENLIIRIGTAEAAA